MYEILLFIVYFCHVYFYLLEKDALKKAKRMYIKISLFLLFIFANQSLWAQETIVEGKVTDAETADAVPFANVMFVGITAGAVTDFDGKFKISTSKKVDSLTVSYVGYKTKTKVIEQGKTQTIDFQLFSDTEMMDEVVVMASSENPAWEILRQAVRNRKQNNGIKTIPAFEYQKYTRVELDIDNISEKFRQKKIVQKVLAALDSAKQVKGDDGMPILPVYVSETISQVWKRTNPDKMREKILKNKAEGIGLDDDSFMAQLINMIFIDYDFYQNWMTVGTKDFVSPIAAGWRTFYEYELDDNTYDVAGENCHKITFRPKRPQDLAFTGAMWITDSTFALKRIDAKMSKSANLNFIEGVRIQQEAHRTAQGYLPAKTRILVDIGEVKDDWAGMLAKMYISNKNIQLAEYQTDEFYKETIEVAKDAFLEVDEFMAQNRHDSLSKDDLQAYNMIEMVKEVPVIKNTLKAVDIVYGYHDIGKIGIGPYLTAYSFNNIEGHRFRLGFRTNTNFSKKFVLKGRLAYGTRDEVFKYKLGVQYILSRRPWTVFGVAHEYDLKQVALYSDAFLNSSSTDIQNNEIFTAFTLWGNLDNRRPFMLRENEFYIQTDIFKHFTQKITFRNREIYPLFPFEYFRPGTDKRRANIFTSEFNFESRWAPGERTLEEGNSRMNLGYGEKPVFIFKYTLGLSDVFGSDLDYQKFMLKMIHDVNMGFLGRSFYSLTASYTPDNLPYPLLEPHLGNRTPVYNPLGFNAMDYFEFVSDQYINFHFTHHFEGMIANRIPLFRRLKWRFLAVGNILYGSVRPENQALIPQTDPLGNPILGFNGLGNIPYMEVGYGIENILKFLRITAVHRLSYLGNPNAQKFGVKFSAQFKL